MGWWQPNPPCSIRDRRKATLSCSRSWKEVWRSSVWAQIDQAASRKDHLRKSQQCPSKRRFAATNPRSPDSFPRTQSRLRHWLRAQLQTQRFYVPFGTSVRRNGQRSCGHAQRPTVSIRNRARGVHLQENWHTAPGLRSTWNDQHPRTCRRPARHYNRVCGAQ